MTEPKEINIPVGTSKDIIIALGSAFNLKTDLVQGVKLSVVSTNEKEAVITEVPDADNTNITDSTKFVPNYKIYGNKIGRVNIIANTHDGYSKNIWINIVNDENAKVSSKTVNGNGYTVALRSNGTIYGFGSINGKNNPEKIEVPEEIIDISSGKDHILLLGKSGAVYTLGGNGAGQLGTGNTVTNKNSVTKLNISNIAKVSASINTSYAITNTGGVYAFGEGYTKTPTILNKTKNIIDITKNYYLTDENKVYRISDDEEVKLSFNEYQPWEEPIFADDKIMQISEGTDHLLLLGKSGYVYSYGSNVYGQLGDGETISRDECITTVVKVKGNDGNATKLENVVEVSAGEQYSIAVTNSGKVYTFGINRYQTLGFSNDLNTDGMEESLIAILKEDIQDVERVTAGYAHTSVYKEDGNVYTWGRGANGELGNAENFDYSVAQLVGKDIIQSNTNDLILKKNEIFDIKAWINYFNLFTEREYEITYNIVDSNLALLDSSTGRIMAQETGRTTVIAKEVGTDKIGVIPVFITENSDIEPQVLTSGKHTLMLKVDGSVWTYGIGDYGELGNGEIGISDDPVKVTFPNGTKIIQIAAGENHNLALDADGNVWAWGRNNYYQLGTEIQDNILTPVKVSGLPKIKKIAAGANNSFAIGTLGEVYSFGLNANGEGGVRYIYQQNTSN